MEISRYTSIVCRSVQRFFADANIAWSSMNFHLFLSFIWHKDKDFILAADEVVEPKSGKKTFGLSHFFSNIQKQTIPAVAYMALSIIDVQQKKSYPLAVKQVVKPPKQKKQPKQSKQPKQKNAPKRGVGRPKGSENKPKQKSNDIQFTILEALLEMARKLFITAVRYFPMIYLTLDGYFGNQHYMRLAKQYKLELISKLKCNSRLFYPYDGQYSGRGKPRKYGKRVNLKNPDKKNFKATKCEDKFRYDFYQMQVWNKSYTDAQLNVVIIICTNLKTKKQSRCILFSTDLELAYEKIVRYYSLRFQIEFNFRDAKQYFGLADFKNYKETQVNNAVNLSFFMCNISYILSKDFKERFELQKVSVLDLKAYYRTKHIVNQINQLNIKPKKSIQFFNPRQIFDIAKHQAVNF